MGARKRKKRRTPLTWVVSVAILALVLMLLLVNTVFVVRRVDITGAGDMSDVEVLRLLSGIRLGTRMSSVDDAHVRAGVESTGRLAFVSLERRLPNRMVLTVRPRSRDAMILLAGKILVLDSDAYVVEISDRVPEDSMPYVTGLKASYYALGRQLDMADGRCGCMKAVVEALKASQATRFVAELSVASLSDLRITTRTGITVLLGDSENMAAKIAWMAAALSDLEARGQTDGQLDVSSGNKADYKPAPEEEEAQPEERTNTSPADISGLIAGEGPLETQPVIWGETVAEADGG